MMRDHDIDLCGAEGGGRAPDMPYLAAGDRFAFRCAGCGGCCRGREDLVLSGYDLYRLSRRLGLPPKITARAFCRSYIGAVSRLPVLRLAPVRAERNNCPFLTGGRCAVHEARPLACALYPLGQEIGREELITVEEEVELAQRIRKGDQKALEKLTRANLRFVVSVAKQYQNQGLMGPVVLRRFQAKLAEALYERYDTARPWPEQFLENLAWLAGQRARLEEMQRRIYRKNR